MFGDVHMLSHLVGAANRADIRRLVALEQENRGLHERADRQQERLAELAAERDRGLGERDGLRTRIAELERSLPSGADTARGARDAAAAAALSSAVALQTRRREAAEAQAASLQQDVRRLEQELAHLRAHAVELGRELAAAEAELRSRSAPPGRLGPRRCSRRWPAGACCTSADARARAQPSATWCCATAASTSGTTAASRTARGCWPRRWPGPTWPCSRSIAWTTIRR